MTISKKSALISTFTTLLSLVVLARTSAAQSYNAAGDFSIGSNPNDAWSYGWSTTLGSAFNAYSISTNGYAGFPIDGWLFPTDSSGSPYVLRNTSAHIVTNVNTAYQPGQLFQEAGGQGQYSIVRWTAPVSGTFSIAATFSGLSSVGDTADVHILLDGAPIFNANILGSPDPASYSAPQNLLAGDTIDFAVGFGSNGNANEDGTSLSATIVPEPGTLGLVGMGFGCLLSLRFLKRK